jgi:signal transduction histidine kinase
MDSQQEKLLRSRNAELGKELAQKIRDLEIEAALDCVRSRSLAMHKTSELQEVVNLVFEKLQAMGIEMDSVNISVPNEKTREQRMWIAVNGVPYPNSIILPDHDDPISQDGWKAWDSGLDLFCKAYTFDEKNEFFSWAFEHSDLKYMPSERKSWVLQREAYAYSLAIGKISVIQALSYSGKLLDAKENEILKRFAKVFEQAYIRFLDLEKAENQAREAQIEAALERVRSRTMAMQKSDELAQTAVVVFKQLIGLGIQPNRLFIGIIKDDSGNIELWATDEDGSKISTRFTGNINRNLSVNKMYKGWKAHKKSLTIDMQGQELKDYFRYLAEELKVPFKLGLSQKRRVQLITYFSQGFIGMASPEPQPEETTSLLERFAGVFNLTYTRFSDLKIAEAHAIQAKEDLIKLHTEKKRAEDALTELQAAQKQLIQSEKMASLGELTAGIAHEIQNPLNFVNNFSEVNQEMIEELEEELKSGNIDQALAIAADIKQNEQKINHHGKRADRIVKGMLQHSRTGGGEKQPTNINTLADEFLRLSYHGLRAKDKTFNSEMVTHFDPELPQINVSPQDMGRVLLNLFNNAFYAVNQKHKALGDAYKSEVSVTTSIENGQVIIKVKDNGNGIPDAIKDKIMQPFFTTKPTGEGTGLGLSLSYDIVVKGHGGSINIDTKENEYTQFTIQLSI